MSNFEEIIEDSGSTLHEGVIAGVHSPEKVAAIRQAASENLGVIAVDTYDPDVPEERAAFINLEMILDGQRRASGIEEYGGRSRYRTPTAIDREVVKPAEQKGFTLAAIHHTVPVDLGAFWSRVDEITTAAKHS